jgi:hypothetical protein
VKVNRARRKGTTLQDRLKDALRILWRELLLAREQKHERPEFFIIHATEELLQDRERRRKEITYFHQKIARLETDLVQARAKATQSQPSPFPNIEHATGAVGTRLSAFG